MMPSVIAAAFDICTYSGERICGVSTLLFGRYTPCGGTAASFTRRPLRASTGVASGIRGCMSSNALKDRSPAGIASTASALCLTQLMFGILR